MDAALVRRLGAARPSSWQSLPVCAVEPGGWVGGRAFRLGFFLTGTAARN